jgi:hypothetical protein
VRSEEFGGQTTGPPRPIHLCKYHVFNTCWVNLELRGGARHAETIFVSSNLNRHLAIIPEDCFQENLNNLHHLDVEEDEKVLSKNTNIRNLRLKVKLLKLLPNGHQLFQLTH